MGLRGPPPLSVEEIAKRGGRARGVEFSANTIAAWEERARKLEEAADALIDKGLKTPTMKTPSNGAQMSADLATALKLYAAADRYWTRCRRIRSVQVGGGHEGGDAPAPDSLEAHRRKKLQPDD